MAHAKRSADSCRCGREFESLKALSDHINSYNDRRLHGVEHIQVKSRKKCKKLRRLPFPRWAMRRLPRRGRMKRFACLFRCPAVAVASDLKVGNLRILWRYPYVRPPEETESIGGDVKENGIVLRVVDRR